ncbi:MAG: hypothetical protein ACLURV_08900 [Gallintestinimicrobium sp.]
MPFITQYSVANTLIVMRQDWLDNLGLSYPQTLDEMKDAAFHKRRSGRRRTEQYIRLHGRKAGTV